jgi:anti-sigma-K factor RskA
MEEMIDNYLLGLLSEAETKAFELRIASDAKLASEVTIQRDLMQAAKLQGLKLEINNAYRKVRMGKMLKTAFVVKARARGSSRA